METRFNRPERNPDLTKDSGRAQLSIFKSISRPFRLASQAKQVFYIADPFNGPKWSVV